MIFLIYLLLFSLVLATTVFVYELFWLNFSLLCQCPHIEKKLNCKAISGLCMAVVVIGTQQSIPIYACCLKLVPRSLLHLLYRIHVRTNYGKFTFKYRAALIWETIPKELKSLNSFAFKRNCKTFLLQNQ